MLSGTGRKTPLQHADLDGDNDHGCFTLQRLRKELANGRLDKAMAELEGLSRAEFCIDSSTYSMLLKQCGKVKSRVYGKQVHNHMMKHDLHRQTFLGNHLMDMYRRCGDLDSAILVFDALYNKNVFSWTIMISSYTEQGYPEKALQLFKQMQQDHVDFDKISLVQGLNVCAKMSLLSESQILYSCAIDKGIPIDLELGNVLMSVYANTGNMEDARIVFNYNIPHHDVISWTTLLHGNIEHGPSGQALKYFEEMQVEGIIPDCVAFVCGMKACGSIGASFKGQEMHGEIIKRGLEKETNIGNTLINMYAECGLLVAAQQVFDNLPSRDLISWNVLMSAYAQLGESEKVFKIFDMMITVEGLYPDMVAILSVFNAFPLIISIDSIQLLESSEVFLSNSCLRNPKFIVCFTF